MIGKRFGRLIVLYDSEKRNYGNVVWTCACACGKLTHVPTRSLRDGYTKSCGCFQKDGVRARSLGNKHGHKHGGRYSRLYRIWLNVKSRCYIQSVPSYKYYGNKNIVVSKEWQDSFVSFRNWAIQNGYRENLTIDRINPQGNYEPNNCQWLTHSENSKKSPRDRLARRDL